MPTTKPRYQVTETAAVARAIDLAAERWPNEPRSRLLQRVLALGSEALQNENASKASQKLAAIAATSGKYADVFPDNHLEELREDWPA